MGALNNVLSVTSIGAGTLPKIAISKGTGNFVVVYISGTSIYAQRYTAAGVVSGSAILINYGYPLIIGGMGGNSDIGSFSVAIDWNANFVVTWMANYAGAWNFSNPSNQVDAIQVFGNYVKSNNISTIFEAIPKHYDFNLLSCDVSMDYQGNFVVTAPKFQYNPTTSSFLYSIVARLFNNQVLPVCKAFRVDTLGGTTVNGDPSAVDGLYPSVAMDYWGNFGVFYYGYNRTQSGLAQYYGRKYDYHGNAIISQFVLDSTGQLSPQYSLYNDSVSDINSNTVVTYDSYSSGAWHSYIKLYNSSGTVVAGPISISTHTINGYFSRIDRSSGGDIVVVYTSNTSSYSIYGKAFDSSGNLLGSEITFCNFAGVTADDMDVAFGNNGKVWVVIGTSDSNLWLGGASSSSPSYSIPAAPSVHPPYPLITVKSGSSPVDPVITLQDSSTDPSSDIVSRSWYMNDPAGTLLGTGTTQKICKTTLYASDYAPFYGQVYLKVTDSTGAYRVSSMHIDQRGEGLVNTTITGQQYRQKLAMNRYGKYVIAWWDLNAYTVKYRVYNVDGTAATGELTTDQVGDSEILTAAGSPDVPISPSIGVAMDDSGNFIIVTREMVVGVPGPALEPQVIARKYNYSGVMIAKFKVNVTVAPYYSYAWQGWWDPQISFDSSGNFIIAYWCWTGPTIYTHISYARIFNSDNTARTGEFLVSTNSAIHPAVAFSKNGTRCVITYESINPSDSYQTYNIAAQIFDGNGNKIGSEIRFVNTTVTALSFTSPRVAMDNTGNAVIVWQGQQGSTTPYNVYARRYNSSGIAVDGSQWIVDDLTYNSAQPSVAMNVSGSFVITFCMYNQMFASGAIEQIVVSRFFTWALGNYVDSYAPAITFSGNYILSQQIVPYDYGAYAAPSVGMDATGNYSVAWWSAATSNGQTDSDGGVWNTGVSAYAAWPTAEANGPYSVTTSASVTFISTGSSAVSPATLTNYSWFINGISMGSGATLTQTLAQLLVLVGSIGTYAITLIVTDSNGMTDYDTSTINLIGAPIVVCSVSPSSLSYPNSAILNSAGTYDPNGYTLTYAWWMNAVGTGILLYSGTSSSYTASYSTLRTAAGSVGLHTIYLVVTNSYGLTAQCSSTITLVNTLPTCNCGSAYGPVSYLGNVILNGSGSSDPDGSIVSYAWWLNAVGSSGTLLTTVTTPTVSVSYSDIRTASGLGTRNLYLVVTDNDGGIATCHTTITLANPQASFHFVQLNRNGLLTQTTAGVTDPMHYAVSGWYKVDVVGQSPILWSTGSTLTGRRDIIGLHPVGSDSDRLYFATINSSGTYVLNTAAGVNFANVSGPCGNTGWHHFYMEVRGRRSDPYNPTPYGRWITIIPDGNWSNRGGWASEAIPPFTGDTGMVYNYTSLGIDWQNQAQAAWGWLSDFAVFSFNSFSGTANNYYVPVAPNSLDGIRVDYAALATGACPLGVSMVSGSALTAFWPLIENYLDYQNHYDLSCSGNHYYYYSTGNSSSGAGIKLNTKALYDYSLNCPPDWRMASAAIPNAQIGVGWAAYSSYQNANIYRNRAESIVTETVTFIGSFAQQAFQSGVLMQDGRVFLMPCKSTSGSIFNPTTNTFSTPPGLSGTFPATGGRGWGYISGVLLPNGNVFCIPHDATVAKIYNPSTDTLSTPAGTYPGTDAFVGGCLLKDGRVYMTPLGTTQARIYDPATNTLITPAGTFTSQLQEGAILLNDGRVFIPPYLNGTQAYLYDPVANTLITAAGTYPNMQGAVLLSDGRVFIIPHYSTTARIYDPVANTLITPNGIYPGNGAFHCGCLLPDGRVFMTPGNATQARIYDPITDTLYIPVGTWPGNNSHHEAYVLFDGRVFCTPYGASSSTTAAIFDAYRAVIYPPCIQVLTSPFNDKW